MIFGRVYWSCSQQRDLGGHEIYAFSPCHSSFAAERPDWVCEYRMMKTRRFWRKREQRVIQN